MVQAIRLRFVPHYPFPHELQAEREAAEAAQAAAEAAQVATAAAADDVATAKDTAVAAAEQTGMDAATTTTNRVQTMDFRNSARNWAEQAEDIYVNDGTNPAGFSSFHWAEKAQEIVDEAVLGIIPDGSITDVKVAEDAGISASKLSYTAPVTGAFPRPALSKLFDILTARDLGAIGDGGTDDTDPILEGLEYFKTRGGRLVLPRGDYLTSTELSFDGPGISIEGEGTGTTWDGLQNAATRIIGQHTTGSILRIRWENCALKNLVLDGDATRSAAARDATTDAYNAGLRVEADDVGASEGDVFAATLENVYARNQPNDGIVMVGRVYGSVVNNCFGVDNKGHGLCIDAGSRTGRTNIAVPGLVTFLAGHYSGNMGHGLAFGNPDDDGATLLSSFRCVLVNVETFNNQVDPAYRYEFYDAYIRGDNNRVINCAFGGGDRAGIPNHHGGLAIAGRMPVVESCRYLSVTQAARVLSYSAAPTVAARFDGMSVRNSTSSTAVVVDAGAIGTKVNIQDKTSLTSAMTSSERAGDDVQFGNARKFHGSFTVADIKSGRDLSIPDDGVATLEFDGVAYGVIVLNGPTSSAGPCIIAFRVGSAIYANKLGGGSTVTATTGVLTGVTGTDTHITVSVHTDNKIYIENRTGALRLYNATLLSVNGGRLLPGQ